MKPVEKSLLTIEVLKETYVSLEKKLEKELETLLFHYPNSILLTHKCGIPHYITDFSDCDEIGVAKQKIITSLAYNKKQYSMVAYCDDNTSTNDFCFNDLTYLLEDVLYDEGIREYIANLSEETDKVSHN